ncbi:hypothetical protein QTP86_020601 [Hemibagrus guttatus]|nr:hypothetical protein QTP86_020601 [Hemibagrus guttatus]
MAVSAASDSGTHNKTDNNNGATGADSSTHPEYIAFGLVPIFFLLGLLGMLICHILKKKGYRCTTDAEEPDEPEVEEEKRLEDGDMNDTYSEGNTDTVGQIVHYIMSNEANSDALKAMVSGNSIDSDGRWSGWEVEDETSSVEVETLLGFPGDGAGVKRPAHLQMVIYITSLSRSNPAFSTPPSVVSRSETETGKWDAVTVFLKYAPVTPTTPVPPTPVSPVSPGAPAAAAKHTCNHLHTIGGMMGHNNTCSRCNQKKWPLMRRGSNRKVERRAHAGEVTVLAVGRFRVTKTDPRPARERRSLLITEPNGSVPTTPVKTEAASLNSSTDTQPKAEADHKK